MSFIEHGPDGGEIFGKAISAITFLENKINHLATFLATVKFSLFICHKKETLPCLLNFFRLHLKKNWVKICLRNALSKKNCYYREKNQKKNKVFHNAVS